MSISDDRLAILLMQFLRNPKAARIVREHGTRSASPCDYVGEIYCALHRQRPAEIEDPERWLSVNAKWHLRNSIRRDRRQTLEQPAGEEPRD